MKSLFKNLTVLSFFVLSSLLFSHCEKEGTPGIQGGKGVSLPQISVRLVPFSGESGAGTDQQAIGEWNEKDQIKALVLPSGHSEITDPSSYMHRYVTNADNCRKSVFAPKGKDRLAAGKGYDWSILSPYADADHFSFDGQTEDPDHPTAHLSSYDIRTATAKNIPSEQKVAFQMERKCALMKVRIHNKDVDSVTVSSLELIAPYGVNIAGTYRIDFSLGSPLIPVEGSSKSVLKFTHPVTLASEGNLEAYVMMPSFFLEANDPFILRVNKETGVNEEMMVSPESRSFKAGHIYSATVDLYPSKITIMAGNVEIPMIHVKGGTFTMGSIDDEKADPGEKPAHQVTLSNYYIGQYEVTQELWETVMKKNPSAHKGDPELPVDNVTWESIVNEFLPKLNKMTGREFSLPTEAQWEYAAQGGNMSQSYIYSGSSNLDEVAWTEANSNGRTHRVGTKNPNELGIYDMSGNVWEWCMDWYEDYTDEDQVDPVVSEQGMIACRVIRGGSYNYAPWNCRIAFRSIFYPDECAPHHGFRLVCR